MQDSFYNHTYDSPSSDTSEDSLLRHVADSATQPLSSSDDSAQVPSAQAPLPQVLPAPLPLPHPREQHRLRDAVDEEPPFWQYRPDRLEEGDDERAMREHIEFLLRMRYTKKVMN